MQVTHSLEIACNSVTEKRRCVLHKNDAINCSSQVFVILVNVVKYFLVKVSPFRRLLLKDRSNYCWTWNICMHVEYIHQANDQVLKKDLFKIVIFHCTKAIDTLKINYSGLYRNSNSFSKFSWDTFSK